MKRIISCLTALFFIAISPLLSYGVEKQQQSATPATPQQEQYEKTMEERLRKIGRQLDELKAKAAVMTKQARKDMNHQLTETEKKRKTASRKLEELRKKSEKEWNRFTAELDEAADDLEKAYEKAKAQFKE
jgi:DNA anti-recombination protein RmuC